SRGATRRPRAGSTAASPSTPRAARRSCARASPRTSPRRRTSRTRCRCPASPGSRRQRTTGRMSAVESAPSRAARARERARERARARRLRHAGPPGEPEAERERRWPYWVALAGILAVALALRLWGVAQGLPYAYNADENAHFVP